MNYFIYIIQESVSVPDVTQKYDNTLIGLMNMYIFIF